MEADHRSICKFEKIDGDDYELVADNIIELAERSIKAASDRERVTTMNAPISSLDSEMRASLCA
jgi:hypothetical protein